MIRILSLLTVLLLTGCDKFSNAVAYLTPAAAAVHMVEPCYVGEVQPNTQGGYKMMPTGVLGFRHLEKSEAGMRVASHCLPCEKANSANEHLACEGDGKESR